MNERLDQLAGHIFGKAAERCDRRRIIDTGKLAITLSLLWIGACGMSAHRFTPNRAAAAGGTAHGKIEYVDPWFVHRAEMFCRLLDPKAPIGRLDRLIGMSRHRNGNIVETVSIDCLATDASEFANFVWDSRSRELLALSYAACQWAHPVGMQMGARTAIRMAENWMRAIWSENQPGGWRIDRSPKLDGNRWHVWLSNRDRVARFELDGANGNLRIMRLCRRSRSIG